MQIVNTLAAGRWRFSVAYRKRMRTDAPKVRKAKTEHSTMAQRVLNKRLSHIGLTGILCNFVDNPEAMFVTLTFDSKHYPETDKDTELFDFAYKEAKLFLQRARRLTQRREQDMKTVFVVAGGDNVRRHVHVVCDCLDGEDLRALWDRGNVDWHRLEDRQDDPMKWDFVRENGNVDPAQIAGYLMENAACCPLGKHPWHASRNCERAERVESYEIPDNQPIPAPEEADIINEEIKRNDYSEFRILELILPKVQEVQHKPKRASA